MGNRLLALGIALTAILAAIVCVPAAAQLTQPYYSVGISQGSLYLFGVGASWDSKSYKVLAGAEKFGSAASLSDVAVYGDYVFVTDQQTGSEKLYVFRINGIAGTPSATLLSTTSLTGISKPQIAVTNSGGDVYVIQSGGSKFACVSSGGNWGSPTIQPGQSGSFASSILLDVAAHADTAIVTCWTIGSPFSGKATQVSNINGDSRGGTAEGNTDPDHVTATDPYAIAVSTAYGTDGYAYVLNRPLGEPASISVFDASTPSYIHEPFLLPGGIDPRAITAFSIGDSNYLSVAVNNNSGPIQQQELWLISLDASGFPNLDPIATYLFNEGDLGGHSLSASWDSKILWVANSGATGSVLALYNGNIPQWDTVTSSRIGLDEQIRGIADLYVPEPSSLAALCSFGLGAIGFARFRRRRV